MVARRISKKMIPVRRQDVEHDQAGDRAVAPGEKPHPAHEGEGDEGGEKEDRDDERALLWGEDYEPSAQALIVTVGAGNHDPPIVSSRCWCGLGSRPNSAPR
jgi:hypothetical protein